MNSRHPVPRVPRAHPARRGFTASDNFYPTWQARANVTARNKDCHFLDKKQSTREYLESRSHMLPGHPAGAPGPLEVIAAEPAGDI